MIKKIGDIKSSLIFIYFKEFSESCQELEEIFGFELVIDYGFSRIFKVFDSFFIGAVDISGDPIEKDHRKMCMLAFTASKVEKLDEWKLFLEGRGASVTQVKKSDRLEYYNFTAQGPEGYKLEFGYFTGEEDAQIFNPQDVEADREGCRG